MFNFSTQNNNKQRVKRGGKGCKNACRSCTLCENRNFGRCKFACKKCTLCTTPMTSGNPYYWGYFRPYDYGYYLFPRYSPTYGHLTSQGHYVNPSNLEMSNCDSACGQRVCAEYKSRMDSYKRCLRKEQDVRKCNATIGCKNWRGYAYANTPPINPKYTKCIGCWKSGYITY